MDRRNRYLAMMALGGVVFVAALCAFIVPAAATAHAQVEISMALPGSTPISSSTAPGAFIADFYQFALMIGGVLAFGVIVFGGVKYMASAGNPSGQGDAKEWIESALIGLLLLAGAYFVLSVVNPQLLNLNLPGLTSVNLSSISVPGGPSGGGGGVSTVPGAKCTAPSAGPCSTASLQNTCLGSNAALAGGVCNVESNGNAAAGGDLSTNVVNGKRLPASVGLFQINLSANTIPANCKPGSAGCLNCPAAFTNPYTGSNPHTTIKDMNLYNQCLAAAENPTTNIKEACQLSNNGQKWSLWGPATRQACGI